jgi:hypothetical protein
MLRNTAASSNFIRYTGVDVYWVKYSTDPTYDATTEAPTYSKTTGTARALIAEPSKSELNNSGGALLLGSKKFVFEKEITLNPSNVVISEGVVYVVKLVNHFNDRNVCYCERTELTLSEV